MNLASLLGAAPAQRTGTSGTVSTCWASQNYLAHKPYTEHRGCFYVKPCAVQERETGEKRLGSHGALWDCGNYLWLGVPVSAIVYIPLYFHRMSGGSI